MSVWASSLGCFTIWGATFLPSPSTRQRSWSVSSNRQQFFRLSRDLCLTTQVSLRYKTIGRELVTLMASRRLEEQFWAFWSMTCDWDTGGLNERQDMVTLNAAECYDACGLNSSWACCEAVTESSILMRPGCRKLTSEGISGLTLGSRTLYQSRRWATRLIW